MTCLLFQPTGPDWQPLEIEYGSLEELPPADEIVALALPRRSLTLKAPTGLTSFGVNSTDLPVLFLNALKDQLLTLLPGDCAVQTGAHLRGQGPHERSEDGTWPSWSYIKIYHTLTEEQAVQIAPEIAEAARAYDTLATDLMVRLAAYLGDKPENFAYDPGYWHEYKQTGRMDEWGYFFHGSHCCFGNKEEWRIAEAAQGCENVTGYGFGELDPGFFTQFCRVTPAYKPLKLPSYGDLPRVFEILAAHGHLHKVSLHQGYSVGFVANHG